MDHISYEAVLTFIGMCIAGMAWLIRVEVKGYYTRKDVDKMEEKHDQEISRIHDRIDDVLTKHDQLNEKVMDKLSTIENIVSKIQGKLEK